MFGRTNTDSMTDAEFRIWLDRRDARRRIIYPWITGIMLTVSAACAVITTTEFVRTIYGDDAWPSGLFLSGLVLLGLRAGWKFWTQDDYEPEEDEFDYEEPPERPAMMDWNQR